MQVLNSSRLNQPHTLQLQLCSPVSVFVYSSLTCPGISGRGSVLFQAIPYLVLFHHTSLSSTLLIKIKLNKLVFEAPHHVRYWAEPNMIAV